MKKGLFVGLATLDMIYLVSRIPQNNEKMVARDQTVAAGGPATNAAVTFSCLNQEAYLVAIVGNHPISSLIQADLQAHRIKLIDLEPNRDQSPPVSSIMVTQTTGERAVISINATKSQATTERLPNNILHKIDIVLIDGHQIEVSCEIASEAKKKKIPVVLDGGSWKNGLDLVLPFVDYAICSVNFLPPNCSSQLEVFEYLQEKGINHIAITQGEKEIIYKSENESGFVEVPKIQAVDTLGAGDIFHGAFCHYILQLGFPVALQEAAKVATKSCQFFGTRQWITNNLQCL